MFTVSLCFASLFRSAKLGLNLSRTPPVKKVDPWLEAGLKAREMRKSLGYSYLAADEIIRSMRALREALPKTAGNTALPNPDPGEEPDS